jgi:hypothetical protein
MEKVFSSLIWMKTHQEGFKVSKVHRRIEPISDHVNAGLNRIGIVDFSYRNDPPSSKVVVIIETHPGGGQYDCLSIVRTDLPKCICAFNRVGSLTASSWFDSGRDCDSKPQIDAWDRIAPVKNSEYRLVASGPISAMSAGTWKDPALTRPKAVSVIGTED